MGTEEAVRSRERLFMWLAALIWLMVTVPAPFLNGLPVFVAGMPILWFWMLLWVVLAAVLLTVAYFVVERG
ncbi:MAG: hypothetical protein DRO39_05695 [Thermoprotei archaeon]|nr:MAG: hypothetical protein DRO39_05695 [Thermoprotei archaeon]